MMNTKTKRCGECGSAEVKCRSTSGPFRWKDYRHVMLTRPVQELSCLKCGNTMSLRGDAEKLDRAIEESISAQAQDFIRLIIERERCRQIDLASIVGVTPEHLSAMKGGARIPSYSIFNFLRTLAVNPSAFQDAANPRAESA